MDEEGYKLDIFLQKRRNKKAAFRFLSRLLNTYPKPRAIIPDKLRSYSKPIRQMCQGTQHRSHKGLNNRVENAHQPMRRKEKCLIRSKSPAGAQSVIVLMGSTKNLFAVNVSAIPTQLINEEFNFRRLKKFGKAQPLRFFTPKLDKSTFCRLKSLVDGAMTMPFFLSRNKPAF
ncbi:DDE-type integrase/transposase/recombinase [Legionella rowbothamii]|uniref:DDE-type integrase/transposase/recombinase n=1 Tax=Legionella rowbothamii TaxID=96229 RepID=UPI0013EF743C|nr:DDE-type integrase/transposase/recombinase [Legionella rowbothamii]